MTNAALPDGVRVYAIGDIHGRIDLLERLLDVIDTDLSVAPAQSVVEVFLGDYVDRGPDCAGVLKRVGEEVPGRTRVRLMGNHEAAMNAALVDGTAMGRWLSFGGDATLRSYGIEPNEWAHDLQALQPVVQSLLPERDLALLAGLDYSHRIGDVFFAHAGIRPGVPLDEQSSHDLLWIREEFLNHLGRLPAFVVHGHTPVERPQIGPWRANVDTGAVYGGTLTALVLENGRYRLLSVAGA
ncbi:metallophosphoesterase family protein [Acuticoccus sp. I52.16.1]|uniref:metallophosphoesterase family protein n=1 Tax=Acuticoccus sp. I52.16.1 TaxID=2928472 RepID=UPI001FD05A84|nr:metallophosphoesterase family protein [Acuticoccus sp. I52.16.1]UOM34465.1 serine/threonine protein phosphatase [Acuticoccus sp. I52.16.1]